MLQGPRPFPSRIPRAHSLRPFPSPVPRAHFPRPFPEPFPFLAYTPRPPAPIPRAHSPRHFPFRMIPSLFSVPLPSLIPSFARTTSLFFLQGIGPVSCLSNEYNPRPTPLPHPPSPSSFLFIFFLQGIGPTSQKTPSLHVAKTSPCLSSAHPPSPALSLPLPIFPTTILPSPSPQRVFASAGDSLSYFNFIPSLLCQIHQASPVRSIPVPPRLAPRTSLVYHVPQYNVTIVNTWSTFLNQCWQDKQTLALYNHGRPVTPEDSVVNMEGVDWRWGRYLAKYDVLLLQSAAHWQPKRTRWRRFFTDRRGRIAYNESRFYHAFWAGMQSVKKLVDRANDKVTRGSSSGSNNSRGSSSVGGSAAGGNKWPVVFFLSAPTKQSGCAASFEPRTEGE
ncbi:unnamed protein product, partial [Closterium sp. Naga37s-1]